VATGETLPEPGLKDKIEAVKKHVIWSCEWKGDRTGILEMRRHYANYFKGIDHFKPFRTKLVTMNEKNEVLEVLEEISKHYLA
jgi:tRNA-dihydrouridine synthase